MTNQPKVDLFKHTKGAAVRIFHELRLNSTDVAVYHSLIHIWNLNFYVNPLKPKKNVLMRYCKVARDTLKKSLLRLQITGFINYEPGSQSSQRIEIWMNRFDLAPPVDQPLFEVEKNQDMGDQYLDNSYTNFSTSAQPILAPYQKLKLLKHNNNGAIMELGNEKKQNVDSLREAESIQHLADRSCQTPPTTQEVQTYFTNHGYSIVNADEFYKYNEGLKWKFSRTSKNWKDYAEIWMARTTKPRQKAQQPELTIDVLYKQYLNKTLRVGMISSNHFDSLQLKLTDDVISMAINERKAQLAGTNDRGKLLLLEAYEKGDHKNEFLISDKFNLQLLAKQIGVLKYFRQCFVEHKTEIKII